MSETTHPPHLVKRSNMIAAVVFAAVTAGVGGGGVGYSTRAAVSESELRRAQKDIDDNRAETALAISSLKKETNEAIERLAKVIENRDQQYANRFERQENHMAATDNRIAGLTVDIKEDLAAIKTVLGVPTTKKGK